MFKSRISILYILHLSTKYTGANKSLLNLLEGLKERNLEPFVVLPLLEDMTMIDELERLGIRYYVLRYFMPIIPATKTIKDNLYFLPKIVRSGFYNLVAQFELKRIVTRHKINIIHTNVGPLLIGFNVAKELNLPHVWHLREFQDLDFNLNTWYSKKDFCAMLSHPNNYTVAISNAVYSHFKLKIPAKVIYNGIMKANDSQLIPIKENYFLYVGFILESKGIDVLLRSFRVFVKNYPNFRLLIAGVAPDPIYLQDLHYFIQTEGIQDNVQFLGHRDDIAALMSKATALVVPSFNEAFGRITAEAMFNGCNVIGKDSGGTKEIIEAVGKGALYSTDEELISALNAALVVDSSVLADLDFARRKAIATFSVESNVESIFDFYNTVLESYTNK